MYEKNCPGYPDQDFPLHCNDNCRPGHGCAGEAKSCHDKTSPCPTPVPPPIPPVRYVPGMNVQEQLCNMAERVNTSINRWNQIQARCYEALDQCVGAAVNNDVYYAPDEVRLSEGYDEDASCAYQIVEARACDRSGKPIFCHLRAAYGNETNSGARELITDVSFVTSGQVVMSAVNATAARWQGTSVFNGNPGNSAPDDTVWVCGWNRNGTLKFYRGDVTQDTLRQNRMVNCIGPVFPVLLNHEEFTEVTASLQDSPAAIQAMGHKPNGNKVFFSCGFEDQPGMTPLQVVRVLKNLGCDTAVITSIQSVAATAWDATPIAGTENSLAEGGGSNDVITAPGMTAGLTFLGELTNAPIQWNIPANCAAWIITKRPPHGWRNAFTTEVANVVQRLGNQENSMKSILGQLSGENTAISKLQYDVQQNTDNIASLTEQVGTFDSRISTLETKMDNVETIIPDIQSKLQQEIDLRNTQYSEMVKNLEDETTARLNGDAQEQAARESADAALRAAITAEESARKSADTVLQNNIDEEANIRQSEDAKLKAEIDSEATTRANADRNLQAAIEAEQSARSTKDTQHEARMDAIEAQEQKDVADLQQDVAGLKDGSQLPLATSEHVGVIKVGRNLTVNEDGTLNANASAGGDTVVEGAGIKITPNSEGQKVVSIDDDVVVNEDELKTAVDGLNTKITAVNDHVNTEVESLSGRINNNQSAIAVNRNDIISLNADMSTAQNDIENLETNVGTLTGDLNGVKDDVVAIQNGSGLPVASASTLGAFKVGANLSISEDGTLSASGGESGTGETVAQGTGIAVEHDTETNVATVSLDATTQATLASVAGKAEQTEVDTLKTSVAGKADRSDVTAVDAKVTKNTEDIAAANTAIEGVESTANAAASGVGSLNSEVTALKATVQTNTQNIDANTTEITAAKADIAQVKTDLASVDDTATEAMHTAEDAKADALTKVSKGGDTMTGNLTVNANIGVVGSLHTFAVINDAGDKSVGVSFKTTRGDDPDTETYVAKLVTNDNHPAMLTGLASPTEASDSANKAYVDTSVNSIAETAQDALTTAQQAASEARAADQDATEALTKVNDPETGLAKTTETANSALALAQAADDNATLALTSANEAKDQVGDKVSKSGDTMSGILYVDRANYKATYASNVIDIQYNNSARIGLTAAETGSLLKLAGPNAVAGLQFRTENNSVIIRQSDANTGDSSTNLTLLRGIADPTTLHDATNKQYVDSLISLKSLSISTAATTSVLTSSSVFNELQIGNTKLLILHIGFTTTAARNDILFNINGTTGNYSQYANKVFPIFGTTGDVSFIKVYIENNKVYFTVTTKPQSDEQVLDTILLG